MKRNQFTVYLFISKYGRFPFTDSECVKLGFSVSKKRCTTHNLELHGKYNALLTTSKLGECDLITFFETMKTKKTLLLKIWFFWSLGKLWIHLESAAHPRFRRIYNWLIFTCRIFYTKRTRTVLCFIMITVTALVFLTEKTRLQHQNTLILKVSV